MRRGCRRRLGRAPDPRQSFGPLIEDGAIVAAGFLADGAGQPALADAGLADQGEIVVGVDPFALARASGTGRGRDRGRRGSRRLRRSPAGAALRRAAAPSGACLFLNVVSLSRSRASQSAWLSAFFSWPAAARSAKALAIPWRPSV